VTCPAGPEDDWGARCSLATTTIVVQLDPVLASNAGDCEGRAQVGAATSVDGLVSAIAADPRLTTDGRASVNIGGVSGEVIVVGMAPDWTGTCKWSDGSPAVMLLTVADRPGPIFGLQYPERIRLLVLDLGGRRVAISFRQGWRELIEPIVETFRFGS
jgi:hypothetical protein